MSFCLAVRSAAGQEHLGAWLAGHFGTSGLVFLHGELGAGKTTLVRGWLHALGHRGKVKSPTYTLVEPYELDVGRIYHLDLYRLTDVAEMEYLGVREMLAEDALLLIEWPQHGAGWLPQADLLIDIAHCGPSRQVCLSSPNRQKQTVIAAAAQGLQTWASV